MKLKFLLFVLHMYRYRTNQNYNYLLIFKSFLSICSNIEKSRQPNLSRGNFRRPYLQDLPLKNIKEKKSLRCGADPLKVY